MLIEPIDDDPERVFSEEEERRLTLNLEDLVLRVRVDDCRSSDYTIHLFQSWHQHLFSGVRDHAGRYRSRDYGEDILNFGPHRSVPRNDVIAALGSHSEHGRRVLMQLAENQQEVDRPLFVREVIRSALVLHALFIKIHPFRDGNGRVGRLIITYVLAKHNLPSIAFEVPKQEYINCLNHYYETKCTELEPLYNLALRLLGNQLDV